MTSSTVRAAVRDRGAGLLRRGLSGLLHGLAWPVRVHEARRLMLQLGSLADHELRDIGLTRLDLADALALPPGADPSTALRRRVAERRRRP